ncbi:MAG: CDP-diacylglycerol--glycerol-3-phosphate 3-phosphatidyltransferase [Candidatus Latescibacteria bacterium]|nr:CDP-diacylglycerol--glycerol-3-phosphate 3-phosphatidyltransferase [Candidatus Latescibacterota bacterium]
MNRSELINLPNCLTISRIFLTPLFLMMLLSDAWFWRSMALVVFGIASLTDFYDGRLARSGNRVTAFGRFLDPLADKILVTSALVAFVWGRMVNFWLVAPVVVRDVLITGVRLYGLYHGRQMVTSRLAKWKTAVQLVSIVVILSLTSMQEFLDRFGQDSALALEGEWIPLLTNGLMGAVLFLTLLSGVHYLFRPQFYRKS